MWIVRLALRRPYTFVVMAMLIVILGAVTILRMPTDIFPDIDIPVISVVWRYAGLAARGDGEAHRQQLRARASRRRSTASSTSRARRSTGVVRRQDLLPAGRQDRGGDRPGDRHLADRPEADSPAGHDAAAHHPLQRLERAHPPARPSRATRSTSSSSSTSATNFLRPGSRPSRARSCRCPYGGKQRQIMVDLDPAKLFAWGLSPRDVDQPP